MTGNLTSDQYNTRMEQLWDIYGPKMRDFAEEIAADLSSAGYIGTECFENTDEEYGYSIGWINPGDEEVNFGIDFQFVEEKVRGGDDDPVGVSFSLFGTYNGCLVLCHIAPHNYTEDWVVDMQDDEAVQTRWDEFEEDVSDADFSDALAEAGVHPLKERDDT